MSRLNVIRWGIVTLLFLATALNYVSRQALPILKPILEKDLGLAAQDFTNAVSAFLLAYTIMYTVSGRLIDRVGVRLGAAVCVIAWSAASILTALTVGPWSLIFFLFLLGVGQPGIFPAGIKACGEWFKRSERALPVGLFSSGASIGAIVAVPLVSVVAMHWGWRWAFVVPGLAVCLWAPLWFYFYHKPAVHPRLPQADRAMLAQENPADAPGTPTWRSILAQRKVWGLLLTRMTGDSVWYFYLFWIPVYLQQERGLDLKAMALFGWVPYLFADIGALLGGGLSDKLIRRGWTTPRARTGVLLLVALLAPLGAFVGFTQDKAIAIAVICLVMFLCQVWSTNTATLVADLSTPRETGTIMGLMGTVGSLWGLMFIQILGFVRDFWGYESSFLIAAVLHPIGIVALILFIKPLLSKKSDEKAHA